MKRALLIAALALATAAPASAQIEVACFAPTLTECSGPWHRSPVAIQWSLLPGWVPAAGSCVDETLAADTTGTTRGCVATRNGASRTADETLKIDMTPPVVTRATASRPPDSNGWYRSPLQISFSGTDATSGLLGCTSAAYGGPDSASATVTGRCTDVAGNVSAASAFGLRYDTTPPAVDHVRAVPGDHVVRLDWEVADAAAVELWRSPGVDGESQSVVTRGADGHVADRRVRNGRRYDYRLLAVDEAGNLVTRSFTAVPGPRLRAPADGARVDGPPKLRWTEVRGARYYNVQLFRGRRKVLSAWPTKPRLKLDRKWRFDGRRYRLKPGRRYRWMVWPGRGARSRNDYGRLIGSATFTVS